jgi:hypothetical protein
MLLSRWVSTVVPARQRSAELQRHGQMRMGRMRLAPQAIGHQDVDAVEQVHHVIGNLAEVCRITN